MPRYPLRILVIEDYEPFRRFLSCTLQNSPELQIVAEVRDGLEAVGRAEELQPDLILLDIGLPTLNGIKAAEQIRKVSPRSKIVFVTQETSADVVDEALATGGQGYVIKADAGSELLTAIEAVIHGRTFVSSRIAGHGTAAGKASPPAGTHNENLTATVEVAARKAEGTRRHEAGFYSDEECFVDGFTQFIGAALRVGSAAVVIATETHRNALFSRLRTEQLDIGSAIKLGKYISIDASEALSKVMINDVPNAAQFSKMAADLIMTAANSVDNDITRVSLCGECAPLLWSQSKADAAIRLEQLWDETARSHPVSILCGYSLPSFQGGIGSDVFEKICTEHSAVQSR